ncbi:aryl hydrocarbon receptor-like isoform X2 [Genypterus blacodes]|uniref:aryl hydrocarbon receptor-like isoform X2 n=1 Tax=Genypterus blacodes TaxID=154954 RepID=UPI003F7705CA
MSGNTGIYAAKKRKKPVLKHKKSPGANCVVKSNPSKRHRDRLNGELERLTDLLPFPEEVRSRLDKLSVLRLSVGYLRVKSYFKATVKSSSLHHAGEKGMLGRDAHAHTAGFSEVDLLLQALNGFVMVVASGGVVTYVSDTVKDYLGFNQSDVIHQSAFELIHTDDRALFRQQLHFALNPTSSRSAGGVLQSCSDSLQYKGEQLPPENSSFLERSFVCRFRCLLDNSSGFLALKFQGRLKYLHGQSVLSDSGTRLQPQLALFAIAVPVQPPSIVEIRSKIMVFQTKHKLDFTPLGIDSRGRIVLGYSELELCMRGTGYQFIHAADMMHCADRHIQMIKTGESGMTVFRLLSKTGSWVWVQANAKLTYKGGGPDFIIVRQKVLVNGEGEEHLRQRSLHLPFSFTTGEAVLYNSGPTIDISQPQLNRALSRSSEMLKDVSPDSLLGCFLRQDQTIYAQTAAPSPMDQIFMDSRALVNIPSDPWQAAGPSELRESVAVKEEATESVLAVIGSLEEMVQNGEMFSALQNLEVDPAELMEWQSVLRPRQDEPDDSFKSELDNLLTNDIFAYMDAVLFKENGSRNQKLPSCLTAGNNNQEIFSQAAGLTDPVHSFTEAPQAFSSTQKLSHYGPLPQPETSLPPIQQLQLQDIFCPSIELPDLLLFDPSAHGAPAPFEPFRQASVGHVGPAGSSQVPQVPQCPQTGPTHPPPPLLPSHDFNSACLQTQQVLDLMLPPAGVLQSGHQPAPRPSPGHTLPPDARWSSRVNGLSLKHVQQGGATGVPQAPPTGFLPGPTGGAVFRRSCHSGTETPVDTSPPQASSYFQWGHSEPVVGTSAIHQDSVSISPQGETGHLSNMSNMSNMSNVSNVSNMSNMSNMSNVSNVSNMQHYLEFRRQTQEDRLPADSKGYFSVPALGEVSMYFSE